AFTRQGSLVRSQYRPPICRIESRTYEKSSVFFFDQRFSLRNESFELTPRRVIRLLFQSFPKYSFSRWTTAVWLFAPLFSIYRLAEKYGGNDRQAVATAQKL
ncbi:MAG TPA: hypothetical protein PK586_09405, partial [Casimicrobium sp.]|nr:hypothetical protein [Casimicrobium sp.]